MDNFLKLDMGILKWLQENLKNEYLDYFFKAITYLTNSGLIWIIIGIILLLYKPTRKIGAFYFLALFINFVVVNIFLKPLFQRVRPCDIMAIELIVKRPKDFSFPSGHSSSAFAAATAIFMANKKIGLILILIAVVVGFSRLYLFVHYPSDVLFGALIGVLSAILAGFCCKVFIKKL